MKMVRWDKSEVEHKDKDQSTSKATLMMLDQNNNQMIRVSGSMDQSGQNEQPVQTQAPAVRRGPYVPPPPMEQTQAAALTERAEAMPVATQIQQPKQVSIGAPLDNAGADQWIVSPLSKLPAMKPYLSKALKSLSDVKRGDWHKMAIGLAAYLFLIGGAVSGAVVGGDRFFKFLSTQMHNMSSDINADQTPTRLKTASLKQ
jgi:hypothetical protein